MSHKGLETYAHNAGQVSSAAGFIHEKDEHAPDSPFKRRPVRPMPAIPTENGRPMQNLDLGARTQQSEAAAIAKGGVDDTPLPDIKDIL